MTYACSILLACVLLCVLHATECAVRERVSFGCGCKLGYGVAALKVVCHQLCRRGSVRTSTKSQLDAQHRGTPLSSNAKLWHDGKAGHVQWADLLFVLLFGLRVYSCTVVG
jgi:hypothetical protein